jgi:hypothetical protein
MKDYERDVFIETVVEDWSKDEFSRGQKRNKLLLAPTSYLRAAAREVEDRRALRGLSAQELREYLKKAREQATTPAPLELPAQYTRETIKALPPDEIRKLIRIYGKTAIDFRIDPRSQVKQEIGGLVRNVRMDV